MQELSELWRIIRFVSGFPSFAQSLKWRVLPSVIYTTASLRNVSPTASSAGSSAATRESVTSPFTGMNLSVPTARYGFDPRLLRAWRYIYILFSPRFKCTVLSFTVPPVASEPSESVFPLQKL